MRASSWSSSEAGRRRDRGALPRHRDRAARSRRRARGPRSARSLRSRTTFASSSRVGTPHCPNCGKRIVRRRRCSRSSTACSGSARAGASPCFAPIARARRGELKLDLERLRREGFVRARIDGELVDLGDEIVLDRTCLHDLDVVVDRVVEGGRPPDDSVELALKLGEGRLLVDTSTEQEETEPRDERALRLRRLRHLAPADRAAHVLLQRPRTARARRATARARGPASIPSASSILGDAARGRGARVWPARLARPPPRPSAPSPRSA
ncbi:MAG: hypothetical protein R3F14_20255 [Polyangiaceae bacterium]